MHIRKQRLLTPGPTPLYPPALHAMMASDIHHRTEDFRKAYRSCLADLKEVLGTSHDVLMFASSGTGAMDASVSNLFSRGEKVGRRGKMGVSPAAEPATRGVFVQASEASTGAAQGVRARGRAVSQTD